MPLTKSLHHHFDSGVRSRGTQYFYQRRVKIVEESSGIVMADVRGSTTYEVEIELEAKNVRVHCTCPYGDGCKHVWATLLAAEQRGFGAHLAGPVSLSFDDSDAEDDEYEEVYRPAKPAPVLKQKQPKIVGKAKVAWEEQLAQVERTTTSAPAPTSQWHRNGNPARTAEERHVYLVDLRDSIANRKLMIHVGVQPLKKNGEWGVMKRVSGGFDIDRLADPVDRRLLTLLNGADRVANTYYPSYYSSQQQQQPHFRLGEAHIEMVLPAIAATGRLFTRADPDSGTLPVPLTFDEGEPWELAIDITKDETETTWRITGRFHRGEETIPLETSEMLIPGLVMWDGCLRRFRDTGGLAWVPILRKAHAIEVPIARSEQLISKLLTIPRPARTQLPEELKFEELSVVPRPRLVVKKSESYRGAVLEASLSFIYDDAVVPHEPFLPTFVQADRRRILRRDSLVEIQAFRDFMRIGAKPSYLRDHNGYEMPANRLNKAVLEAAAAGWLVEAEGKLYRRAGHFNLDVKSSTDWFDLQGSADFEGKSVPLPRLLSALKQGIKTIVLDDGSVGMLPEEWLKQYGLLAQMGTASGESFRFGKAQVGVLDVLLASRPEITFDEQFDKARNELKKFNGVDPADPPAAFKGELRGYQRDGLGWLRFLRKFGFGGCLADDMGLGKTVQVLAHLASKRKAPVLVVVPKSLIFNWKQEAARFAPKLKVLDHTGLEREKNSEIFAKHDIVLTTYGTLRRDAALFSEVRFDTCVLDESQAAKNASTETAKAVKLIQADHRLALSGTPIENHLGELWTLFDFLNPGMLGRAGAFGGEAGSLRNPGPETRELLAKALKPFILRRTKKEVAKDLPEKTEQTIFCELEAEQRKLYDELRDHYRIALLSKVDELGLKRTKIQVLAALLRLRQAACHPGLIDDKRTGDGCAKLDTLVPQIQEVIEEGHKVLVFSQFTSFLAIAKYRFDDVGLDYEYLDGKTRDRAARVERFQTDPDCKLFLVSLKAGGVGLNLTAADYVYLLDPWWNPAVEAQAIDRTHRIGQNKPVFAYRIIAKNTVEEKVLELQKSKKALADSILDGDGRLITELKREDLELLLS